MGGFGGSSNSFGQMPTGAAPTPTSGANYPPINARASLNTNGYGRLYEYMRESVSLCLYWCILSPLCTPSQMALSLGHSSPLEQRRQCGPSGRASSTRRVMQSSILTLRATSKTCFLWVIQSLISLSSTFFSLSLSLKINLSCLFNLIQDVLSMLDQPANFNSDDFEIPIYPSFNEWPGQYFSAGPPFYLHDCYLPSVFLMFSSSAPLLFLLLRVALFPCFAWLQLHCRKPVKDGGIYLTADI